VSPSRGCRLWDPIDTPCARGRQWLQVHTLRTEAGPCEGSGGGGGGGRGVPRLDSAEALQHLPRRDTAQQLYAWRDAAKQLYACLCMYIHV
jgi:hypothetical protein